MKYRIRRDEYLGYEVLVKKWWWPFWICPQGNTHKTYDEALKWVNNYPYIIEITKE